MNFAAELKKLLETEEFPPNDPLTELARVQEEMLDAIYKNNSGISLQVEEIYDIIKESDENVKEVKSAAKRESALLGTLIVINDLLDSLLQHMQNSGAVHAEAVAAKMDEALNNCDLEKFGSLGQQLDPRFHTVASAENSDAPLESVIRVLENGYIYRGNVVRKATVNISKGSEHS